MLHLIFGISEKVILLGALTNIFISLKYSSNFLMLYFFDKRFKNELNELSPLRTKLENWQEIIYFIYMYFFYKSFGQNNSIVMLWESNELLFSHLIHWKLNRNICLGRLNRPNRDLQHHFTMANCLLVLIQIYFFQKWLNEITVSKNQQSKNEQNISNRFNLLCIELN